MIKQDNMTDQTFNMTDAEFDEFINSKIYHNVDRGDSMFNGVRDVKPELSGDDWADYILSDMSL
jgi:hypothetical protein